MGDCHLECTEKGAKLVNLKLSGAEGEAGREAHEFIGPVRVVIVETSKHDYRKKTWGAAFVTMAFLVLGATYTTIFFITATFPVPFFYNFHILFFTTGFQLLSPAAFLTMHTYNGAESILKVTTRKQDYGILRITSLLFIVAGTVFTILSKNMKLYEGLLTFHSFSFHAFTGMMAVGLSVLDVFSLSCIACNTKRMWPRLGIVMCVPSFFMSSVSFLLAVTKPTFQTKWLPEPEITYYLMGFCVFYTFFACFDPIRNLKRSTMMKK